MYHRILHRGQRISVIVALSTEGVLATEITNGTVDGTKFVNFIEGKLIPEMIPFNGENPNSISILDNSAERY